MSKPDGMVIGASIFLKKARPARLAIQDRFIVASDSAIGIVSAPWVRISL
jgi:hypothetical protein